MGRQEIGQTQPALPDFFPNEETLRARLEAFSEREQILAFLQKHNVPLNRLLKWPERRGGDLSDLDILRHLLAGNVVISPFNIDNLSPNSYDVSLGENYFRQVQKLPESQPEVGYISPYRLMPEPAEALLPMINPFDSLNVEYTWRLQIAERAGAFMKKYGFELEGVDGEDRIIVLDPEEIILAHTQEFIGGRNVVSCSMSARSSAGRTMIRVCNDANLGNIGFINRWTMEIQNGSNKYAVPLVVGGRYAQITFHETGPSAQSYNGVYQSGFDLELIQDLWFPETMLPRFRR